MRLHEPLYLLSMYLSGNWELIVACIGLGILSACPYIGRRIIDHV